MMSYYCNPQLQKASIMKAGITALQESGVEALNKEHFDAFLLIARGFGALAKKYDGTKVGAPTAAIQKDILALMGVPENEDLELILNDEKKIRELRRKYVSVDKQIINNLKNPEATLDENFAFIGNISGYKKLDSETEREYKIKVDIDKLYRNYHKGKITASEFENQILPLLKELKGEQNNRNFVKLAGTLSEFNEKNAALLRQSEADSNTIAFLSIMNTYILHLHIAGGVEHIAIPSVAALITEQSEGVKSKIAKKAGKDVGGIIPKEIVKKEKNSFKTQVELLENTSYEAAPVVHDDSKKTVQNQKMAKTKPATPEENLLRMAKLLGIDFDIVKEYSFSEVIQILGSDRNELEKAYAGFKLAKDIISPYTVGVSEDSLSTAFMEGLPESSLFTSILEDEALNMNYKILMQYKTLISALAEKKLLGKNEANGQSWLERIEELEAQKVGLNEKYAKLKADHKPKFDDYSQAKKEYDTSKIELETLKKEREKLKNKLDPTTLANETTDRISATIKSKSQEIDQIKDAKLQAKRLEISNLRVEISTDENVGIPAKYALKESLLDTGFKTEKSNITAEFNAKRANVNIQFGFEKLTGRDWGTDESDIKLKYKTQRSNIEVEFGAKAGLIEAEYQAGVLAVKSRSFFDENFGESEEAIESKYNFAIAARTREFERIKFDKNTQIDFEMPMKPGEVAYNVKLSVFDTETDRQKKEYLSEQYFLANKTGKFLDDLGIKAKSLWPDNQNEFLAAQGKDSTVAKGLQALIEAREKEKSKIFNSLSQEDKMQIIVRANKKETILSELTQSLDADLAQLKRERDEKIENLAVSSPEAKKQAELSVLLERKEQALASLAQEKNQALKQCQTDEENALKEFKEAKEKKESDGLEAAKEKALEDLNTQEAKAIHALELKTEESKKTLEEEKRNEEAGLQEKKEKLESLEGEITEITSEFEKKKQETLDTIPGEIATEMANEKLAMDSELIALDTQIEVKEKEVLQQEISLVKQCKVYNRAINDFKNEKRAFNAKAGELLRQVSTVDPHGEPHLSAMQSMTEMALLNFEILGNKAKPVLDTALEHADSWFNAVGEQSAGNSEREMMAIPDPDKKSTFMEKAAGTVGVMLVSVAAAKQIETTDMYVQNIESTLAVEAAHAKPVVKESSRLSRFFEGLAAVFRNFKNSIFGNKNLTEPAVDKKQDVSRTISTEDKATIPDKRPSAITTMQKDKRNNSKTLSELVAGNANVTPSSVLASPTPPPGSDSSPVIPIRKKK